MRVFAIFEHSLYLELAITELEQKGLNKDNIFVIGVDQRKSTRKLLDSVHYSDGISLVDGATVLGSLFMVLGAIYGFLLEWGPIVWGLIGLAGGILIGGVIDLLLTQRRLKGSNKKVSIKQNGRTKSPEVIVIVNCAKDKANLVEEVLEDHFALGTAKYEEPTDIEINSAV